MNFGRKPTCVDESRLGKKSRHLTPYYSLSSISKGYKLYELLIIYQGSRSTWFAASAERKFILKVEKLMNPEVFWCFSCFSRFLNFSWFWEVLVIRFGFPAKFPARGWFRIPGTSIFCYVRKVHYEWIFFKNFTLIQILSARCFDCLAFVESSRFACAH